MRCAWLEVDAAHGAAAFALCVAIPATGAVGGDIPADSPADYVDIEDEIIVTAEKPAPGEVPSPTYIVQTYSVVNRGSRLYREGRYREALPHLVTAAKRGFKWAQARAGDIYLHGRDGVPRNIEAGIGWLGVAAMPETDPAIRNYFRDAMAEVRPEHLLHFATIVAEYRRRWSSRAYRVTCERAPRVDGIHGSQSLRIQHLRCTFMDEIPLCRTPYDDPSGGMEWICDKPRD